MANLIRKRSLSQPSADKGPKPTSNAIDLEGHRIEVRGRAGDDESLWIDGERRQFFVSSGGYHLLDDAYRPGEKTLLEAARKHVERRAKQAG